MNERCFFCNGARENEVGGKSIHPYFCEDKELNGKLVCDACLAWCDETLQQISHEVGSITGGLSHPVITGGDNGGVIKVSEVRVK